MSALKNAPKLTTYLHAYWFDISELEGAKAYSELVDKMEKEGRQIFEVSGNPSQKNLTSGTIELACNHLFNNQWNTTDTSPTNPNQRVFDWYQERYLNRNIKAGYWLEITKEMEDIRENVLKCGYCGAYYWKREGLTFCNQCLDSEFLKESELNLLRLLPISKNIRRKELTKKEKDYLLPLYISAQTQTKTARAKKKAKEKREKIKRDYEKAIAKAETEFRGYTWLLDHDIPTDNVIYYSHTKRFCFGWQSSLSDSVVNKLLKVISEFPYSYDIKCEDGKTLSGEH